MNVRDNFTYGSREDYTEKKIRLRLEEWEEMDLWSIQDGHFSWRNYKSKVLDISGLVHFFKVQVESIAGCEINLESSLDHANYEGHG